MEFIHLEDAISPLTSVADTPSSAVAFETVRFLSETISSISKRAGRIPTGLISSVVKMVDVLEKLEEERRGKQGEQQN